MNYDIIGDVRGQAVSALRVGLLWTLGSKSPSDHEQ